MPPPREDQYPHQSYFLSSPRHTVSPPPLPPLVFSFRFLFLSFFPLPLSSLSLCVLPHIFKRWRLAVSLFPNDRVDVIFFDAIIGLSRPSKVSCQWMTTSVQRLYGGFFLDWKFSLFFYFFFNNNRKKEKTFLQLLYYLFIYLFLN